MPHEIKPHSVADLIPGGKHSARPLKPAPKPTHSFPQRSQGLHPPKLHTEIKHKVVATNTRGASVFLKGATAKKN